MLPIPANIKAVLLAVVVGAIGILQSLTGLNSAWTWIGVVVQILSIVEAILTVPASARAQIASLVKDLGTKTHAVLFVIGFGALGLTQQGCKGAQFPSLNAVEQVVVDDLMSCGSGPVCVSKMEQDVATLIAQGLLGPTEGTDAVMLVKDALQLLIDAGVLPQDVLPKAKSCLSAEKLKLSIRSAQ